MRPRSRFTDDGTDLAPQLPRNVIPFDPSGELGAVGTEWARILLNGITVPDDLAQVATADKICQFRSDGLYPAGDGSLITGISGSGVNILGFTQDDTVIFIAAGGGGGSVAMPPSTVVIPNDPARLALIIFYQTRLRLIDPLLAGVTFGTAEALLGGTTIDALGYGYSPDIEGNVGNLFFNNTVTALAVVTGVPAQNPGNAEWGNFFRSGSNDYVETRERQLLVLELT